MTTLYRKYRPKTFGEIIGQKYVLQTLTNSIKNKQISHAYLFTGPRGTGKTTTARIFAKTINCLKPLEKTKKEHIATEPCNQCANCQMILNNKSIDLIEIDAASHTGVDNIRQLKEAIDIPPTNFKYKVYIIDEVHMLSMGAFNALLKTLEEPPAHAVFILATTELHKVPETIISRCQQFNIKPLNKKEIKERLKQIAEKEEIKIDDEALSLIAGEAGGGMRDAESIFGQIISTGQKLITPEYLREIMGLSPIKTIHSIIQLIINADLPKIITLINNNQEKGINIKSFHKQLVNYLRTILLYKINPIKNNPLLTDISKEDLKQIIQYSQGFTLTNLTLLIALLQNNLNKTNQSDIPQLPLEMALIEFYLKTPANKKVSSASSLKKKTFEQKNINGTTEITSPSHQTSHHFKQPSINQPLSPTKPTALPTDFTFKTFLQSWSKILEDIQRQNKSLFGILSSCRPDNIENDYAILKVNSSFHQNILNSPKNKLTIENSFVKILKVPLKVKFIEEVVGDKDKEVTTKKSKSQTTTAKQDNSANSKSAPNEKNSPKTSNENNFTLDSDDELLYEALRQVGGKIVE